MPRVALQLAPEFITQISQLVGLDVAPDVFDNFTYIVLEPVDNGTFSFNITFMTEDDIFEAAANDPELEITTF
jgi:hypothetical protein